ncbi:MAG: hypothetical protein ACYDHO_05165 [Gaiellaceae bacterium]
MIPTLEQIDKRARWIGAAALGGALALQTAILDTAVLRGGSSPYGNSRSVLLSHQHHFSDVVAIAGLNCAWLAGISLLAWPIARLWSRGIHDTLDHPAVNEVARFIYPLVAVGLLEALWWIFSEQARALDGHLSSHWALFATLLHGTPEFSALLLPLAAAASCIFAPAERPGRLLLSAISLSVPLLLAASLIEVYLTPHLLIPFEI